MTSTSSCGICLEEFNDTELVTKCDNSIQWHVYHVDCAEKRLKTHEKCSICTLKMDFTYEPDETNKKN